MIASALSGGTPSGGIVTDGLVFRLNGLNQGNVPGHWIDEIGDCDFNITGLVSTYNGVIFDGSVNPKCASAGFDTYGTAEFCVSENKSSPAFFSTYTDTGKNGWNVAPFNNTIILSNKQGDPADRYLVDTKKYERFTLSLSRERGIFNKSTLKKQSPDVWNRYLPVGMSLGSGSTLDSRLFIGTFHELRIYNRPLAEEEILQNQQYDIDTYFGGVTP